MNKKYVEPQKKFSDKVIYNEKLDDCYREIKSLLEKSENIEPAFDRNARWGF